MRLPRPYIPLRVRVQVAERQLRDKGGLPPYSHPAIEKNLTASIRLKALLCMLFGDVKVELHHRPALVNRRYVWHWSRTDQKEFIAYDPPANDPDYLVYLPADEHDIETRVRGQHGDYSDLAKARKRKRKEKKEKRSGTFKARRLQTSRSVKGSGAARKYRWPKRKLRSRPFAKRAKGFRK